MPKLEVIELETREKHEMIEVAEMTDAELLKQYHLDKNPSSLNILFSRYLDVGFRTAMRYMRNQSDAEDVLQVAFMQFLNNLHHFREDATSVKPWLMKMIVNTSIKKLREEKNRAHRQQKVASQKFAEYSAEENTVEKANDKEDLKTKIKTMVDTLPEKYRSPIWLVLYEGFSYPEVATVLALPEKTVRTQVSRGMERLKEILGSFGSVISVDAIAILMIQSTRECAPASAQKIIASKELYQSIGTKILKTASHSDRLRIAPKALFSTKLLATVASVFLISIGVFFISKNKNIKEDLPDKEIRASWNLKNERERNLALSMGTWKWSDTMKGMVTPVDKGIIIRLPPVTQDKIFLIESTTIPNLSTKPGGSIQLLNSACWMNGKTLITHEEYVAPLFHTLENFKPAIQKTYCYKNYIISFTDDILIRCDKFPDNMIKPEFGLFSINFVYQIISCQSLKAPPQKVLDAIATFNKTSHETKLDWEVNDDELKFERRK